MAFQPDNCRFNYSISGLKVSHLCSNLVWNSRTMNDVGQFIFPQDDFRGAQANLNFSGGIYHYRTLFEITKVLLL